MEFKEIKHSGMLCLEQTCPYLKTCANHETAGDHRTEGGFSPKLQYDEQTDTLTCSSILTPSDGDSYHPMPVGYHGQGYVDKNDLQNKDDQELNSALDLIIDRFGLRGNFDDPYRNPLDKLESAIWERINDNGL